MNNRETFFAPAKKSTPEELSEEISLVQKHAIMDALLQNVGGLLAILDDHRQIIALNDAYLKSLHIDDPALILGLRHGEAMHCTHAHDSPAGCGTTEYCSSCGAAISIVVSLAENSPVEKNCILTTEHNGDLRDIVLRVRSQPICLDNQRFLLLFMQDISRQQTRAALERTFFHDINNILTGLVGAVDILDPNEPLPSLIKIITQTSFRLQKEVEIQRVLTQSNASVYQLQSNDFSVDQILKELKSFFTNHPSRKNIQLKMDNILPRRSFHADISLLLRILCNMITNALEASDENGVVTMSTILQNDHLVFSVNNQHFIPTDIQNRIFQRNFSTKNGDGRGLGTYSMKLLGETILKGKVTFSSSQKAGTTFTFSLPLQLAISK